MNIRKTFILISSFVLFLMHSITFHEVKSDDLIDQHRVLFISSYSPSFPTFFNQIEGLRDVFRDTSIVLDIEYMDSKRFFTPENIDNFKTSLLYKLNSVEYELIVTSDDNATTFVMDNRAELFPDIPVVFLGTNNESNAYLYALEDDVTGVVESTSIEETIQLAISLNQQATNIVALVDNTVTGQSELVHFYNLTDAFPQHTFKDINLGEMTLNDYIDEIGVLDETSIIVLIAALRDIDGTSYESSETSHLIAHYTNQPVYHLYDFGIEDGLIGGKVVSHYIQGKDAAELVVRYFNGESFDTLDLIGESPNVYMINYEVFEAYDYDESVLPEGTIFINKELTVFEQYGSYIIAAVLFLIVQSTIIISLILSVRNRNKARLEVVEINKSLNQLNDDLYFKSNHDELTTLFNRNYFEEQYPRLSNLKDDGPVSIVLIDVNGLKLINDAFGHFSGDTILKETAQCLLRVFESSDLFRIGGDEFAVIPYGRTEEQVSQLIQELNQEVAKITIEGISVSVSIGYAFLDEHKTLNEIFTEAEDWMYREKLSHVPSNRSQTIDAIIATINQKDKYSEEHSKRVSELSVKIAQHMGINENMVNEIKTAGLLHDIGKIIVPISILNKPGKLTNDEFEELKKHSEIGYRILNSISSMRDIANYVLCHHERIDGLGYPRGLKKDEIPLQSRIIAIADAIDAMLTDRLYRDKLSKEECKKELLKFSGTQFCSKGIDVTIANFDDICSVFDQIK